MLCPHVNTKSSLHVWVMRASATGPSVPPPNSVQLLLCSSDSSLCCCLPWHYFFFPFCALPSPAGWSHEPVVPWLTCPTFWYLGGSSLLAVLSESCSGHKIDPSRAFAQCVISSCLLACLPYFSSTDLNLSSVGLLFIPLPLPGLVGWCSEDVCKWLDKVGF